MCSLHVVCVWLCSQRFYGMREFVVSSQSEALSQLVALYVGRCAMLWKDCDVIVWLESVVKATLALVDAGDSRLEKYKEK